MLRADSHCDTITRIEKKCGDMFDNCLHLDMKRLSELAPFLQVMAVFINKPVATMEEYLYFVERIARLNSQTSDELELVPSIEGLYVDSVSYKDIESLYANGVRMISLTWNHSNALAAGIGDNDDFGLTSLGAEIVRECEALGILIDVSHASVKTFYDIAAIIGGPLIASHSNSKQLCNHKRNLSDEQLKIIGQSDGYVGVNFHPPFLRSGGRAEICDIVNQFLYISDIIGQDRVGFGCDFDGIETMPVGIEDVRDRIKVEKSLTMLGMSEKIFGQNLKDILKRNTKL